MRVVLLAGVLVLLSACATGPAPVSPQEPAARQTGGPGSSATGSGAVDALLDQARDLRAAGDLEACFARLERALRIAPQHADVYLELARSHASAGNSDRATASAERGLLYCMGDTCRALRRYLASQ